MVVSMTGYGKMVEQLSHKKITVEIRTLNSKSLDLNMRLPSIYREKELLLRQHAAKELLRGKVDFAIHVEHTGTANQSQLNIPVIEQYIEQLKQVKGVHLRGSMEDGKLLEIATRLPEVMSAAPEETDPEEFKAIEKLAINCLKEVTIHRKNEGDVLEKEFQLRIENIALLLKQVIEVDVSRLDDVRTRLEKAVSDLKENLDANRFEQELIFYLEKYDITEEKVRLKNHLEYFKETMNAADSQGKKLGFIAQEIGREINTIGSKSNHAVMQQLVVQMKDELEKIKEQMLNVL